MLEGIGPPTADTEFGASDCVLLRPEVVPTPGCGEVLQTPGATGRRAMTILTITLHPAESRTCEWARRDDRSVWWHCPECQYAMADPIPVGRPSSKHGVGMYCRRCRDSWLIEELAILCPACHRPCGGTLPKRANLPAANCCGFDWFLSPATAYHYVPTL